MLIEPVLECTRLYFYSLEVSVSYIPNLRESFIFTFICLRAISENEVNSYHEYIEIFPYNEVKTDDQTVNWQ